MFPFHKLTKELIIQENKLLKVQLIWDQDFNDPIQFVIGDEWKVEIYLII